MAALVIAGVVVVVVVVVSRNPQVQKRFWAQFSLMADRLDQLVTAIRKPAVPEEPAASVKPGPSPQVPSEPPMEKPVSDQDKRKLEEVLEPKTPP
ncbi:MAG: hypothetical protein A2V67_07340 [Deltaproteobacteria bacterium RBG_13_61_14]|nr:MAG: hypothetical protein A2V67_07340 [Deltaproteobacteria bacterium RBG_13_61_14]